MQDDMEYWAGHVAAIASEGIFVSTYAKRESLSLASLYYWRRKLSTATPVAASGSSSSFVQLRVAGRAPDERKSGCTLQLAGGMRLELSELPSPDWLAGLMRAARGNF